MSVTNEILRSAVGLTDEPNSGGNDQNDQSLRPGSKEYIEMVRQLRRTQSIRNLKAAEARAESSGQGYRFLSEMRRRMKQLTIKEDKENPQEAEDKKELPATPDAKAPESPPSTGVAGDAAASPGSAAEELKSIVAAAPFQWNDGDFPDYHRLPANDLAMHLDSMFGDGLTSAEANRRLELVGANEPKSDPKLPLWKLFLHQFTNIIVVMLIASSIVALSLKVYVEGVAILVIIIINAVVAVYTEISSTKALEALMALTQPLCSVRRDGEERTIPARLLVPGDLVMLKAGDIIPADGRLIQASEDFTVNEFLLTTQSGEVKKVALDVRKEDEEEVSSHIVETGTPSNMAFGSTSVSSGSAQLLVVTTGMATRVAAIAQMLQDSRNSALDSSDADTDEKDVLRPKQSRATRASIAPRPNGKPKKKKTPLQRNVDQLAIVMGIIAIVGSALVFLSGTLRGQKDPNNADTPVWLNMLLVAVSLAVSCIPEALPLIVTLCLTMGAKRLGQAQALVRQLSVLEALGAVDVICADKTGTITHGKMTVVKLMASQQDYEVTGKGINPDGKIFCNGLSVDSGEEPDVAVHTTLLSGLLCSNAAIQQAKNGAWQGLGTATEIAIVVAAAKLAIQREESFKLYPRVDELPFSTERKLMLTMHRLPPPEEIADDASGAANGKAAFSPKGRTPAPLPPLSQPFTFPSTPLPHKLERIVSDSAVAGSSDSSAAFSPSEADDGVEGFVNFGEMPLSSAYKYVCCVKGAGEEVLKASAAMVMQSGRIESLTAAARKDIQENMERLADEALRVIAVAFKPLEELPFAFTVKPADLQKLSEKSEAPELKAMSSMSRLLTVDPAAASPAAAAVAVKKAPSLASHASFESEKKFVSVLGNKDLIFCGLLCCIDPERDGVQRSVEQCRKAGIRVVMFTGDFRGTAVAIARNVSVLPLGSNLNVDSADCSILRPKGKYLSNFDVDEITQRVSVFSRAKPEDKMLIVQSLQRQGHVCAVAGDGVNDVSALRQARIAISMGSSLSVVKQASKLVLADDNFASVVDAIRAGRGVSGNLQKFVLYMFSANCAQIIVIFLCVLIGFPSPFAPLQILFMNLVTDCLPAMALTMQPEEGEEMNARPRPEKEPIIRGNRVVMIAAHTIALTLSLLLVFLVGMYWHTGKLTLSALYPNGVPDDELSCSVMDSSGSWTEEKGLDCITKGIDAATTMSFITVMIAEMIRMWVVRHYLHDIFYAPLSNPILIVTTLLCLALMLLVTLTPGVQDVFNTANLQYHAWLLCLGCALFPALIDESIKFNYRSAVESEQQWKSMRDGFSSVLNEVRAIRRQMDKVDQLLLLAKPEKEKELTARTNRKFFAEEEDAKAKKPAKGRRMSGNFPTLHPRLLASATQSAASSSSSSSFAPNHSASPSASPSTSISLEPFNRIANAITNAKTVPPRSAVDSRAALSDLESIKAMIIASSRNETIQENKTTDLRTMREENDPLNWHASEEE